MRMVIALLTAMITLATSCSKDQDDIGYRPAAITFRTDSMYTHQSDTVAIGDTVLIGALVAEGSERLRTVIVEMRVNGGGWVGQDTIAFGQNPMAINVQAIMGDVARTEDWSIHAVERNGTNTTRRSLTFTVVE